MAQEVNPKTNVYIGGLDENVTEEILRTAFTPFGEVKEVNIPLDNASGKHRGFGFVEFFEKEDAAQAMDNMHNAELYGKVLNVNIARPLGKFSTRHKAVWEDADAFMPGKENNGNVEVDSAVPSAAEPAAQSAAEGSTVDAAADPMKQMEAALLNQQQEG